MRMKGTTTTAQQQHKKERKPFIWQDHMTEVRELFRRVERVKRRGFSGFSTWADDSPTAETLSKNRLRRRRAQFAVDLTHLNYKEEPFESLTHIHNIRGMCSRIQRQVRLSCTMSPPLLNPNSITQCKFCKA